MQRFADSEVNQLGFVREFPLLVLQQIYPWGCVLLQSQDRDLAVRYLNVRPETCPQQLNLRFRLSSDPDRPTESIRESCLKAPSYTSLGATEGLVVHQRGFKSYGSQVISYNFSWSLVLKWEIIRL